MDSLEQNTDRQTNRQHGEEGVKEPLPGETRWPGSDRAARRAPVPPPPEGVLHRWYGEISSPVTLVIEAIKNIIRTIRYQQEYKKVSILLMVP